MRRRSSVGLVLAAPGLLLTSCTVEDVVSVEARDVAVVPASANALEGERFRLLATVHDESGAPLSGAQVTWSTSDTAIAVVDAEGWVQALGPGNAEVTATYKDASGSAAVRVLRGPSIAVSHTEVALTELAGGTRDTVPVFVTNDGAGTLDGLETRVSYGSTGPTGWLVARLVGTTAPTQVTVTPGASLSPGVYGATLHVTAADQDRGSAEIQVTLTVTAAPPPPPPPPPPPAAPRIALVESGGGTFVTEGGSTDTVSVALASQPASNVMLQIRSADSGEVTVQPSTMLFTPTNWNAPQLLVATGVDEPFLPDFDGDQVVTITIDVVDGQSDPAYWGLSATVRATNVDNDGFE